MTAIVAEGINALKAEVRAEHSSERKLSQMPAVAIVTVTYNSAPVLPDFMESVLRQTQPSFVLIIVDSGSSDDTLRVLGKYEDERIIVLANKENVGIAEGNNQGIRYAQESGIPYVLLINNDTVFPSNLIEELLICTEENKCDIAAPKMLYHDSPKKIWYAGGEIQRWAGGRNVPFGQGEDDNGQYDHVRRITFAPACCLLLRTKVFDTIGLMDPQVFVYWDDVDFLVRAGKAGIETFYTPKAFLYHKVSSLTGGLASPFVIFYNTRNRVYYIRKHFDPLSKFWFLSCFQLYIVWKYALRAKWIEFKNAEKAFVAGMRLRVASSELKIQQSLRGCV